jgi:hypothetical protein
MQPFTQLDAGEVHARFDSSDRDLENLGDTFERLSLDVRHYGDRAKLRDKMPDRFIDPPFPLAHFETIRLFNCRRRFHGMVPSRGMQYFVHLNQSFSRDFCHIYTCSISFRTSSAANTLASLLAANLSNCKTICNRVLSSRSLAICLSGQAVMN